MKVGRRGSETNERGKTHPQTRPGGMLCSIPRVIQERGVSGRCLQLQASSTRGRAFISGERERSGAGEGPCPLPSASPTGKFMSKKAEDACVRGLERQARSHSKMATEVPTAGASQGLMVSLAQSCNSNPSVCLRMVTERSRDLVPSART